MHLQCKDTTAVGICILTYNEVYVKPLVTERTLFGTRFNVSVRLSNVLRITICIRIVNQILEAYES